MAKKIQGRGERSTVVATINALKKINNHSPFDCREFDCRNKRGEGIPRTFVRAGEKNFPTTELTS
jgi:hypothetical protein